MKARVLKEIEKIIEKKKAAKRWPNHALAIELFRAMSDVKSSEVKKALNDLYGEGKIKVGNTINDTWINTTKKSKKHEIRNPKVKPTQSPNLG